MDEYSRKRSVGGLDFSRRNSSHSVRETNHEDKSIRCCNRLGCSTRPDSMKGTQVGSKEKPKYPKASFNSKKSKCIGGSSSNPSSTSNLRKPPQGKVETNSSKERAIEENESEGSEFSPKATRIQSIVPDSGVNKRPTAQKLVTLSSEASGSKPCNQISRKMGSNSQDIPSSSSSSIRRPMATRSPGPPRNGLKILNCSSTDVLPSGCSSDHGQNRRVSSVRKRPSDKESSLVGGKSISGSSSSSISVTNRPGNPQQAPRRARYRPLSRDGPVSVRTRRPFGGETRPRLSELQDDNIHTQITISEVESSSMSYSMEPSPIFQSLYGGRSNSINGSARSRLISSHLEDGNNHGPLGDRDGYRRFNMEGITEVLLTLERIEHDNQLTYEQLMVLETNLFLGGFSFHDQHRDMQLDIDNMTYEELLALEEEMGTVSTALSEEALSKCLERSSYMPSSKFPGITACEDDDVKCSICQEEYDIGDEMGKLACDHCYHVDCIHQWLRQKNWCPICKSSAASHAGEIKD